MKELIIFDMDGVLIDSEPLYFEIEQKIFQKYNITISDDEHDSFIGLGLEEMWKRLKREHHIFQSVEELVKENNEHILQFFRGNQDLQPTKHLLDFLDKLNGYKLAVASSTSKAVIKIILEKINVFNRFDFIISGEEVKAGKPEPDIFLDCAAKMGFEPQNCIVIEDSQNGVKAAKAARMKCIGYLNPNSGLQDLSKADLIIKDFNELNVNKLITN